MPGRTDITPEFENFFVNIGVRKDIAHELWEADIHSPQELAAMETEDLKKVTCNALLVNNIHPIMQKYVFNISMAKDPYKAAIKFVKKQAQAMEVDEDDEHMEHSGSATVAADSTAFYEATEENNGRVSGKPNPPSNNSRRLDDGMSYNNSRSQINSRGNNQVQSNIQVSKTVRNGADDGVGHTINITGGNFVQANVLGKGPVTYNNTNTVINASVDRGFEIDVKKRRAQLLNSTLYLDGMAIRTADIGWNDNQNFWVDKIRLPPVDDAQYHQHLSKEDVYHVRTHGRALILNNIEFTRESKLSRRTGADVDCKRMEELLTDLGFKVQVEKNKNAAEMQQLLREFATTRQNRSSDMSLVYIGSHGERDERGNDTFVGSDGKKVKFNDVREMFSAKNSPLLHNRPKLFLLQFCRQEGPSVRSFPVAPLRASSVMSDAGGFIEGADKALGSPAQETATPVDPEDEHRAMDMLCVFATLAGNKAYRDTADGSWFVTALIRVFQENSNKDDVLSMLTKVNNSVSINKGKEGRTTALQVSEFVSTLRKKLFFYPGQIA